jgi:predicted O-methyltransferase YrrM
MDPSRIRRVIQKVVHDREVTAHLDESRHQIFPVAIGPEEGDALRELVVSEYAAHTVEVGLGYGISSLFICEGLVTCGHADAHHVAIDPFQRDRFANVGLQLLDEAGVGDLVTHYREESQTVLPGLLASGQTFDFAFVDGNHRFEWAFVDLYFMGRLVRPGGAIVLDDYQLPAVARAASFFISNREWRLERVSGADDLHTWAVLRTHHQPDDRPFTYFVDF